MKNQRQIIRIKGDLEHCGGFDRFAFAQIENALVLHYQEAYWHFKWYLSSIFKFKCGVCGFRHIRKPFHHNYSENSSLTCFYGYFTNFSGLIRGTFFHLIHGED